MISKPQAVVKAAIDCIDNAATIGDTAQIPSDLTEKLGSVLVALAEEENDKGILTSLDPLLNACDQLYLAFFDQVIIPGQSYRITSESDEGVRYIKVEGIQSFEDIRSSLLSRITTNPDIFNGKPIIRGHRLAVEHVLGMLNAGDSIESLLESYPWLEQEDIQACLLA